MKGAEAVLTKTKIIGIPAVIKERQPKNYREKQLDISLRKQRTRAEARLLHRAKIAGVLCPVVLAVGEFDIALSYIRGRRPKINEKTSREIGEIAAHLHTADIAHGDFTPANLIEARSKKPEAGRKSISSPQPQASSKIYVIDFGLGFISNDVEDKAIDVYTMLKSLKGEKLRAAFMRGYAKYPKAKDVEKRLEVIKGRIRYAF